MRQLVLSTATLLLGATPGALRAADAPGWPAVSAIFAERCTMCHSALGAALGLRLDAYDGALGGSERGPVLVPGDAGASELVRRLRGDSVPRMPFLSYPLPPEEIDLIIRWVEAGLPETVEADSPPGASGSGAAGRRDAARR